jgi:integration host factor subunit beta
MLEAIRSTLEKGGERKLEVLEAFDLNYRPPRNGRNPKSGDKVSCSGKVRTTFQAR